MKKHPEIEITKKQLGNLFEFTTSRTHFLYAGSYHDLIDKVAMDSALGQLLTNLFMGYHEKIWLGEFKSCEVILDRRYVDEIICLFSCEKDAD